VRPCGHIQDDNFSQRLARLGCQKSTAWMAIIWLAVEPNFGEQ